MDSAEEVLPDRSLLAFATSDIETDPPLIVASSQCPFYTKDRVLLNVECFGPIYNGTNVNNNASDVDNDGSSHDGNNNTTDEWPILLYVHGICESAETQGVQTLAQYCAKHCWRLIVLELAGHGLSDNISFKGRATCPNFDQLVQHVVEFTLHIEKKFSQSKGMVLSGGSLGGALVVYAVQDIISERSRVTERTNNSSNIPNFYGIALLAPALGINNRAIPPSPVVVALRALSFILPSQGILTPVEHSEYYAYPASSTRNFSGQWPLSTSSMLLDLTSVRVPGDVKKDMVHTQLEGLPSLLVIAGENDEIVPLQKVRDWYESSGICEKELVFVKGAGHGFFHERDRESKNAFESLFEWLDSRASN